MRHDIRALVLAAMLCGGCAPHSPFIVKNTSDVSTPSSYAAGVPHTNRVIMIRASLPPHVKYEVLGEINAGRVWYGSASSILDQLATHARALGADAVIEIATWHQPSGFSWAAPHGRGIAVRVLNKEAVDLQALGEWR